METLLSIRGLRIAATDGKILLDDFNLDLAAGERMAIVGESGSGKTMAARAVLGLLAPGVRCMSGAIVFEGQDLVCGSQDDLRRIRGVGAGMVFQEPMTSLNPAIRIGRQLDEALALHTNLPAAERKRLTIEMLSRVRIKDPEGCLSAYPHEFSGGMRQRIMLASVLLLKPRLLIADEPTTALDTLSQREVLDLMVELTQASGTALLLITHDLGLVARYTDRVLVVEKGVTVEVGDTQSVLSHPSHPYTARLVGSLPQRHGHRAAIAETVAPVLSIEQLSVDYPGKTGLFRAGRPNRVLSKVDLDVRPGEIVALVGASGSGKTTLGRSALGLKPLAEGSIRFEGNDITQFDRGQRRNFRRQAQLIFQDPFSSLDPRLHVRDIVGATLRHLPDLSKAERAERVRQALEEVGLTGFDLRLPHQMSGGQRQRVAIARAIVSRPKLVVADEPVSALDLTIQLQVLTLLQRLQAEQGFACLFITHDLAVVEQIADRVVVMENGEIVEEGPTDAVFADPQHPYTRELLAATPKIAEAAT